jgi:hypothetical protein
MGHATGLSAPEDPVALPDGTWLIVDGGAERGSVTQISDNGITNRAGRISLCSGLTDGARNSLKRRSSGPRLTRSSLVPARR